MSQVQGTWEDGGGRERAVHKWGLFSLPSVCNAGRGLFGPLEAHELNAVGAVLDVNVLGTIRMLQAFLPDMKRRHSGRVLVTASVGGLMGERKGRVRGSEYSGEPQGLCNLVSPSRTAIP